MKKVLLLLAEGFEIFEASVFIDVMGWNQLEGDGSTQLISCGFTKDVKSAFGQKLIVDQTIDEIDPADFTALAIPGGFEDFGFYDSAYRMEFLGIIRHFDKTNKIIASICTGALPIAKSGVLQGRKGTCYNINPLRQKSLSDFGVLVQQEAIVMDSNITTSWNPSTALDVAFGLLQTLTSRENTDHVKKLMGFSAVLNTTQKI